jgi:hypothetical protein
MPTKEFLKRAEEQRSTTLIDPVGFTDRYKGLMYFYGSLSGAMSGCRVVSVLKAVHCILPFAFLPLDNVELNFVIFFKRLVSARLNR